MFCGIHGAWLNKLLRTTEVIIGISVELKRPEISPYRDLIVESQLYIAEHYMRLHIREMGTVQALEAK
jgi:hypothetical protein